MGCDIHGVFQRWDEGTKEWVDIPSEYEQDRHYQLFAVLANVRNGYGFAGCPTGDSVIPISEPRGLPHDFVMDTRSEVHPVASFDIVDPRRQEWREKDERPEVWMGDHSHSWLTGEEMLAWAQDPPMVTKTGVLSRSEYAAWDRVSRPEKYCGGVMGKGIKYCEEGKEADKDWTHISVSWPAFLGEELAYFFDEVKRLVDLHGTIRFVFGFDS